MKSNQGLSITFSPEDKTSATSSYWVRIEDVTETEAATAGDVAALLDEAYDRNPCEEEIEEGQDAETTESGEPESPVTMEELVEKANAAMGLSICYEESYTEAKVKIIRSHIGEPYNLKLNNGEIVSTVRETETKVLSVALNGESQIELEYPISDPDVSLDAPYTVDGSNLLFEEALTASFTVEFSYEYDLVTVRVPHESDGSQGECRALCFYHMQVEEHDLEIPEPEEEENDLCSAFGLSVSGDMEGEAECYKLVHQVTKCKCSDDEVSRVTVKKAAQCSEGMSPGQHLKESETVTTDRVWCNTDGAKQDISETEFFEESCCTSPGDRVLPRCSTIKSIHNGGIGIKGGAQKYKDLYGEDTRIVGVGPEEGPCGELTVEWKVQKKNCCDEAMLIRVNDTWCDKYISNNSRAFLAVSSSFDEIYWDLSGAPGLYLDGGLTKKSGYAGKVVCVYSEEVCGTLKINAYDGCNDVDLFLVATTGHWELVEHWDFDEDFPSVSPPTIGNEDREEYVDPSDGGYIVTSINKGTEKLVEYITSKFVYTQGSPWASDDWFNRCIVPLSIQYEKLQMWNCSSTYFTEDSWHQPTCCDSSRCWPDACNASCGGGGYSPICFFCGGPFYINYYYYGGPWRNYGLSLHEAWKYKWVC